MSQELMELRIAMIRKQINQKQLLDEMNKKGYQLKKSALSRKINRKSSFSITEMELIADILGENPVNLFFNPKYTNCVHSKNDTA